MGDGEAASEHPRSVMGDKLEKASASESESNDGDAVVTEGSVGDGEIASERPRSVMEDELEKVRKSQFR